MGDVIEVDVAQPSDVVFIDSLQKVNAEELSFYPKVVFEREILASRILLARVNGDPAGYIYHGAFAQILKIHQACIEYDLRGQLYGAQLVRFLEDIADKFDVMSITLRCGSNIPANGFWQAMGFYCQAVTPGGVRRMRDINNWRKDISPQLFVDSVQHSKKQSDASLWRKHKGEKKSQFMRGKQLNEYRREIIAKSEESQDAPPMPCSGNST